MASSQIIAMLDSCVLYSGRVRDLMMRLAMENIFSPRWSHEIHDEWMDAVLKKRPDIKREQLERTRILMERHVSPNCCVSGYEQLIPSIILPDPDDRHVVAAAVHTRAQVIVTFNLKDFPPDVLNKYNLYAQHPDEFLYILLQLHFESFVRAAKRQRCALMFPPKTKEEFLWDLSEGGLPRIAQGLSNADI